MAPSGEMRMNGSSSNPPVIPTRQIEAIKAQQTWSIWLVTVQLAVIAAVVTFDKPPIEHKTSLVLAITFSAVSIIIGSFLLSAHPSMILRIKPEAEHLNISLYSVPSPRSLIFAALQHYAFIAAVICYAIHVLLRA